MSELLHINDDYRQWDKLTHNVWVNYSAYLEDTIDLYLEHACSKLYHRPIHDVKLVKY